MAKYRKKPVIIEASRWWADGDHPRVEMPKATVKDAVKVCKKCDHLLMDHGMCETLEGYHIVCPGDWIITGIADEVYPCKPGIFEKTYEAV